MLEPSDPNLTKPPPPNYLAASNFPSHDLKADLPPPYPPPYPGGMNTTDPPAPGVSDAAYPPPPPTSSGYPQTAAAPQDAGAGYPPSFLD